MILTILWYYILIGTGLTFMRTLNTEYISVLSNYLNTIGFKEIGIEDNKTKQKWYLFFVVLFQSMLWPFILKK